MRKKTHKYTQAEYADSIKTDQPNVSRLFNDGVKFTYKQRLLLKSLLGGEESDYLISGKEAIEVLDLILDCEVAA